MLSMIALLAGLWAGFLILAFIAGLISLCVFHLPYYVWLCGKNDKGLFLDLKDVSFGRQLVNTAKWWRSIFNRKPAF